MAQKNLLGPGQGINYPQMLMSSPSLIATAMSAATTELGWSGYAYIPSGGPKTLVRVGFPLAAITSAGGSTVKVEVEAVGTSGPPMQPADVSLGTPVAIAPVALSSLSPNAWWRTAAFASGATLTVNPGDKISIVASFATYGGSDSLQFRNAALTSAAVALLQCVFATKIGGTWAAVALIPNVVLEFLDGGVTSWGTLYGAIPCSFLSALTLNSGSTPSEVGLAFTPALPYAIDAVNIGMIVNAAANWTTNLYQGTTLMTTALSGSPSATISGLPAQIYVAGAGRTNLVTFPGPTSVAAGTQYILSVNPTTANNIVVYYIDVADVNHLSLHPGGVNYSYCSRPAGGGAWTFLTTRRPMFGLNFFSLPDDTGGGGGQNRAALPSGLSALG